MHSLPIILMLLGASVVSVILFRRMNLPPMLGYLVVGALVGPDAFNLLEGFSGAAHLRRPRCNAARWKTRTSWSAPSGAALVL